MWAHVELGLSDQNLLRDSGDRRLTDNVNSLKASKHETAALWQNKPSNPPQVNIASYLHHASVHV